MRDDTFQRMMKKMEDAFQDMERAFRGFDTDIEQQMQRYRGRSQLPVDIEDTGDAVEVRADLPGMEKDQIDVAVTPDSVQIAASDEREVAEESENYVRQERQQRSVQRTIGLPVTVDPDSAEASYDNGVLTVEIDKEAEDRTNVDVE